MRTLSFIACCTLNSLFGICQLYAADEWALAVLNQLSTESKQAPKPSQRLKDLKLWNEFLEKTGFATKYPQLFNSADKAIIEKLNAVAKKDIATVTKQLDTIKQFKSTSESACNKNLEELATFFSKTLAPKIESKRITLSTGAATTRLMPIQQNPLNNAELATMLDNEYPGTATKLANAINSYSNIYQQYNNESRNMLISLLEKSKSAALFDEPTRQKFAAAYQNISNYQQKQVAAVTQKQSQAANLAANKEEAIIAILTSSTAPLAALFSCLDTVLATNYEPRALGRLKSAISAGITRAITLITDVNYASTQSKITDYIKSATSRYISKSAAVQITNKLVQKIKGFRASVINAFINKIKSFNTNVADALKPANTPATVTRRQAKMTKVIQSAAAIIDEHTQLAPATTELAQATLASAYTNFNASIIKLIQDQGFITKTENGTTTYTLTYNAALTEPKTSLKKVLACMSAPSFPQLTPDQKKIITSINASIA